MKEGGEGRSGGGGGEDRKIINIREGGQKEAEEKEKGRREGRKKRWINFFPKDKFFTSGE